MKNEPHVIGDRVPDQHGLIADLKLAPQGTKDEEFAPVIQPGRGAHFPGLYAVLRFFRTAGRQRRNRLALLELNDEQLKDIGLSRCQAYCDGFSRYRRSETE